jgi:hypothetical protein
MLITPKTYLHFNILTGVNQTTGCHGLSSLTQNEPSWTETLYEMPWIQALTRAIATAGNQPMGFPGPDKKPSAMEKPATMPSGPPESAAL